MTHSLSESAARFVSEPTLTAIDAIISREVTVPKLPGVYGWWFDRGLEGPPREGCRSHGSWDLLYVGISPSRAPKAGTRTARHLRVRLRDHIRGPVGSSTLRRALASLLQQTLGLVLGRNARGKAIARPVDEIELTNWMSRHARVSWVTVSEPWNIEAELLDHGPRLPLNIDGSADSYRHHLKRMRKAAFEMQSRSVGLGNA